MKEVGSTCILMSIERSFFFLTHCLFRCGIQVGTYFRGTVLVGYLQLTFLDLTFTFTLWKLGSHLLVGLRMELYSRSQEIELAVGTSSPSYLCA